MMLSLSSKCFLTLDVMSNPHLHPMCFYILLFVFPFLMLVFLFKRVKCHFTSCGSGHFASLVQRFYFSHVGPKRFHRCHFSPLG
ncbi:hypothetical protein Hanom_Chr12g01126291 [Helianthus anomalus]